MDDINSFKNNFFWISAKRDKLYKCDSCNLNFIFQNDMLDHFDNNHKSSIYYDCSFCTKKFEILDCLLLHTKTKHLIFIYLCKECDFQSKCKQEMLEHILSHATLEQNHAIIERMCLTCGICPKVFSQPLLLRQHMTTHFSVGDGPDDDDDDDVGQGNNNFQNEKTERNAFMTCGECHEKFSSLELLKRHLNVEHNFNVQNEPPPQEVATRKDSSTANDELSHHVICIFCLKKFSNKEFLEIHEKVHFRDIDPLHRIVMVCDFCGDSFKGALSLRQHLKSCSQKLGLVKFKSIYDPILATELPNLTLPEKVVAKKEFRLKTNYGKEFLSIANPRLETDETQINETTNPELDEISETRNSSGAMGINIRGSSSYVCHYCYKGFRSKIKFLDHYFEHDKTSKSFSCIACDTRFGYSSSMPKHAGMHQRDLGILDPKPLNNLCPKCGKHYRDRASLKRHEAMVHQKVGYPCLECGRKFSSSQALRQHQRQHRGEYIYQCDLCTKKYANASSLHNHRKTHSENKLSCTLCPKLFSLKHHLARHIARHAGFTGKEHK